MSGLCFGSFAAVVCRRTVSGESVVTPRSYCLNCRTTLKFKDLIPLASWLFLRGKCRYCKAPLSLRYPLIEAAAAVLFTVVFIFTGLHISILPLWGLIFVLLCVAVIDTDTMKIPDGLLIAGAVCGAAWVLLNETGHNWQGAVYGMAAGALPLFLLNKLVWIAVKKQGFGMGDVKLMAVAGMFLGMHGVFTAYFIAFVSGGVFGAAMLISGKAQQGEYLPFAPFLCSGVFISLFV